MTARSLPSRPDLDQLKRQAKELLRRQPQLGRLRDAQRALAEEYGFASWDELRTHVVGLSDAAPRSITKPPELYSEKVAAYGMPSWHPAQAMLCRRRPRQKFAGF